MTYPANIDQFTKKLNKKQDGSIYVIEEAVVLTDGKYEGILDHDNIMNNTVKVYTGPKLTGEEITNVLLSIPAETPWKRSVKIFADVDLVYVTYETPGDQVEAEDINLLQGSLSATQTEIERYKGEGHINGGTF